MLLVIIIICTVGLFYKAGQLEDSNVFGGRRAELWAAASAALWAVALLLLHWGALYGLLLQAGLFAFLTLWGMIRERHHA